MAFYVKLEKHAEDSKSATYSFWTVPEHLGELKSDKSSGEVLLLLPVVGDEQERLFARAAMKLRREWQQGRLPESTEWAS